MTPTATLSDDRTIPVLGVGVSNLAPEEAEAAVGAALQAGYRLIDTDAVSGNEEAVGRAIAGSGIAREELFVTTKLATADQGFQSSQDACKASLARLGLDYVDLYLIDWPAEENGKYIDAWGGLLKSQAVGDTRSIGVANFNADQLSNIIDLSYVTPVVNQVELHPLLNQDELRQVHAEYSIVTEAYCPLAAGTLLDNSTIANIAATHDKSAAQVLIRWSIQQGNVVLVRATTPAHLTDNSEVLGFELSESEMAAISALDDGTRLRPAPST